MQEFIIKENDANQSVFNFLKKVYQTTPLSVIYKWFRKKEIKVNNHRINDQKLQLKAGDVVVVYDTNQPLKRTEFKQVDYSLLEVVYSDENILVVNKPFNIEVHSEFNLSLDAMVRSYLVDHHQYDPGQEQSFVVSHVHRLDKLTGGLVIYAKNKPALTQLLSAIKTTIEKQYVLHAAPGFQEFLDAPGYVYYDSEAQKSVFSPKESDTRMKPCHTQFKLISQNKDFSVVEASLKTGRKHQIRATLAYYGFPIINDFRYQGKKINNQRMIFLKAYKIIFHGLNEPLLYLNERIIEIDQNFN